MTSQNVYIVCADGEEHLAEILATPLRNAGYVVSHDGTVLVGESKVATAKRHLEVGDPLVLCATAKACGSEWAYRLVNAANAGGRTRAFVVRMEANALVDHMAPGEKCADYFRDPAGALEQLVDAMKRLFPPVRSPSPNAANTATSTDYMDELVPASEPDMDAVRWFRDQLRPELRDDYPDILTDREFLTRIGVLREGLLTRAGVLLFGRRPTDGTPSAIMHCARYYGTDQTASRELSVVQGTAPEQIIQARDFIARHAFRGERPTTGRAASAAEYAYPMIAVREIVANAVVHRDYRDHTANVHVRLFDGRLEISNPGRLLKEVTVGDDDTTLDVLEGQSIKRNFRLAHLLTWVRLVEGEGSGIPTAIQDCEDSGAPLPRIIDEQGFVTVRILPRAVVDSGLNPKYQFDTFVIGSSNRFAHAAAVAVAEAPAKAYNPLFIYGESGLGKTHLLHAIGRYTQSLFAGHRARYVSAEEFTNEFINSVRDGRGDQFRRSYRDLDLLLFDDIQFLEGKEQTQEEFFHTFNTLYNANKQIVIASDRSPHQLATLDNRLRSRLEAGLVVDLRAPELENRIAILSKKAAHERLDAPPEVLEFIAGRVTSNIRELEGALNRVTAFASLNRQSVDVELTQAVLRDLVANTGWSDVAAATIMEQTAEYFGTTVEDLCGSSRSQVLVTARQMAMYLCWELTDLSLPKIGSLFGGRDHTTVMHACRKIRSLMHERRSVFDQVREITTRVNSELEGGSDAGSAFRPDRDHEP
jgi:chromosomal replication initiator protein DnaA